MDSPELKIGRFETVDIDDIRPYWRNPRRVTEEDVNRLAASIKEFGYQQPIVVDEKFCIIVGHTRYAALRRLDVEQVPVLVATELSEEQVKQYRLIDNRVAEYTSWDFDKLTTEIEGLDKELIGMFFPELGGVDGLVQTDAEVLEREWDRVNTEVDFVCPSCFHGWTTDVTRDDIMSGQIGKGPQ